MVKDTDIRDLIIDGEVKTALHLGEKEDSLPRHVFQGEKFDSLIVKDGNVRKIRYT